MTSDSTNNFWWLQQDPIAAAETDSFQHIIPSRQFLREVMEEAEEPWTLAELAEWLRLEADAAVVGLARRLNAMCRDGQLHCNRAGEYALAKKIDLVAGVIHGHPDGFGFLLPDEDGDDLFLAKEEMRRVFHGDKVLARVKGRDRRGRLEGSIVEVTQRNTHDVVGRFVVEDGVSYVEPSNPRLIHSVLIDRAARGNAQADQIVVAKVIQQPNRRTAAVGEIVAVLGDASQPGMETEIALRSHGIPHEFPAEVVQQAKNYGAKIDPKAIKGRVDLRATPLMTIDGEDARDFDDAVFAEPKGKGWRLLVAIADVAEYVTPGSPLDNEAIERGTSVYFPNRVVPMLPEALSNGLCSLNPKVDRLALVCEMQIDAKGKVTNAKFYEAVICSHARLTYNEVWGALSGEDPRAVKRLAESLPHLQALYALYQALSAARRRRGTVDFETSEASFMFDAEGRVAGLMTYERNDAHKLIEECMIAANVEAARHLQKQKLAGLYRNHAQPSSERIERLVAFLGGLGIRANFRNEVHSSDYQKFLKSIADRPDFELLQTMLLRSMAQARYEPECEGHFGLALEEYAHFTSPIRRYPDLLVHRAIKALAQGHKAADYNRQAGDMEQLGKTCSNHERRAEDASRDVQAWLKCEYVQQHLGESFNGTIASVTNFGLFVMLDDLLVEGLVHVSSLSSDYYHYDENRQVLAGERSGREFSIGDKVRVTVAAANPQDRKIDLALENQEPSTENGRKGKLRPKLKPKSGGGEKRQKGQAARTNAGTNKRTQSKKNGTKKAAKRVATGKASKASKKAGAKKSKKTAKGGQPKQGSKR